MFYLITKFHELIYQHQHNVHTRACSQFKSMMYENDH